MSLTRATRHRIPMSIQIWCHLPCTCLPEAQAPGSFPLRPGICMNNNRCAPALCLQPQSHPPLQEKLMIAGRPVGSLVIGTRWIWIWMRERLSTHELSLNPVRMHLLSYSVFFLQTYDECVWRLRLAAWDVGINDCRQFRHIHLIRQPQTKCNMVIPIPRVEY